MTGNVTTRHEKNSDPKAIWKLNQSAFGGDDEASLVDALRDSGFVEVSLVAECDQQVVGHILFSRVSINTTNTGAVDALSLAPMAVAPDFQRQGIGTKIAKAGLEACQQQGHQIVIVLGHPEFYSRFGFNAELARPLASPFGGGKAWMAIELVPGALAGVVGSVKYPPPFGAFESP